VTIKAIQTFYNGHHFRSRAEARYAVFLTELDVPFLYEHEGWELPGGMRYLPDFYLPEQNCVIEIKGTHPTPEERSKAEALADARQVPVFISYGELVAPAAATNDSHELVVGLGVSDTGYWWCECEYCGLLGLQWRGHGDRMPCGCYAERGVKTAYTYDTPRLIEAYACARAARFEFKASTVDTYRAAIVEAK